MSLAFPTPDHMPCPDCGASVPVEATDDHVCEDERRVDFQLVELRPEIERFEDDLSQWLQTPEGSFARWLAELERP